MNYKYGDIHLICDGIHVPIIILPLNDFVISLLTGVAKEGWTWTELNWRVILGRVEGRQAK